MPKQKTGAARRPAVKKLPSQVTPIESCLLSSTFFLDTDLDENTEAEFFLNVIGCLPEEHNLSSEINAIVDFRIGRRLKELVGTRASAVYALVLETSNSDGPSDAERKRLTSMFAVTILWTNFISLFSDFQVQANLSFPALPITPSQMVWMALPEFEKVAGRFPGKEVDNKESQSAAS